MKKLVLAGLAIAVAAAAWRWARPERADASLAFDRFWVDHLPRDWQEPFDAFVIRSEHPVGHHAVQTVWKGQWEGFHYHVRPRGDGEFDFLYPASGKQERVRLRARRCDEGGFAWCLDVEGASRGARRYYSREDWRVAGGDLDALLERIAPAP